MKIIEIIGTYYLYHFLLFIVSLVLLREWRQFRHSSKSRFAVLFPAHNEENVIAGSIQSILDCNYPRELFDVFIIADNCNDRTAEISENAGAKVLQRVDKTFRGKQHALKWAFEQINLDDYDAFIVLDADNYVHPDYLHFVNAEMVKGHRVIQGFVETKNPCDSWVTANYAYMFWYICRLQMIRTRIGLSAWLAGTGLCISTDVIRSVGWHVQTMTDDVEYTCQLICAGEKVVFAPDAVVYDQKPRNLRDSMNQRLRWIRGQTQTCILYIPRLLVSIPRYWWKGNYGQAARAFDAIMWIPMHLILAASVVMSVSQGWWQYLLSIMLTVPAFYILPMVAERIKICRLWMYLVTAGVFFLTWLPVTCYGVVSCGNKDWWRTPH